MIVLEEEKPPRLKRLIAHGVLWSLLVSSIVMIGLTIAMVWPYNDVRYATNISKVKEKVVQQGGQLTLVNPSICIDDQNVTIYRWAELLVDGEPIGAYELFDMKIYNEGKGLVCYEPSIYRFTLPNYIIGLDGQAGTFRIHNVVTYQANLVNSVEFETWSEPFLVVPDERNEDERRSSHS